MHLNEPPTRPPTPDPAVVALAPGVTARRPSSGTLRLVVLPMLVGIPLMGLSTFWTRRGFAGADLLLQWIAYGTWGWWARRSVATLELTPERVTARPGDVRAWRYLLLVVPLIAFDVSVLVVQTRLLATIFPAIEEWLIAADPEDPSSSIPLTALKVLTGATLVAVVEELVFRGVLLRAWTRRFGHRRAMIGTALLFGVFHQSLIGSVVFALVVAIVYRRTGTLLLPIVMHSLYNAVVGLSFFATGTGAMTSAEFRQMIIPAVLVMMASLGAIALTLYLLGRQRGPAAPTLPGKP